MERVRSVVFTVLLAAATHTEAQVAPCAPFPVVESIPVGDAKWVGFADLDGDTAPDMILSYSDGGSFNAMGEILVVLNDGSGGYTGEPIRIAELDKSTGLIARVGIHPTDLDLDGDLDLVCIHLFGSGQAFTLINEGGMQFGDPVPVRLVNGGVSMDFDTAAVGDLTGDGIPDIVYHTEAQFTVQHPDPLVTVYKGNGDGTFVFASSELSHRDCESLAIPGPGEAATPGVVTHHEGFSTEFTRFFSHSINEQGVLGPMTLVFIGEIEGYFTNRIVLRDLDGDGLSDIVMSNRHPDLSLGVFMNTGFGFFSDPVWYPRRFITPLAHVPAFVVEDLDADGDYDAVIGDGNGEPLIFPGNPDGTFDDHTKTSQTDGSVRVMIADVDVDGRPDLITERSQELQVLKNEGALSFGSDRYIYTGGRPIKVELADLNGDGYPDAAVIEEGRDGLSVHLSDGTGGFLPMQSYEAYFDIRDVHIADLNGDKALDIVTVSSSFTYAFLNDGQGGFSRTPGTSGGGRHVSSLDLNGDTIPDLVYADRGGRLQRFVGDGGGGFAYQDTVTVPDAEDFVGGVTGDVDSDGLIDGVFFDEDDQVFVVTGLATESPVIIRERLYASGVGEAKLVDMNSDGRLDLVFLNVSGGFTVALNAPNGRFLLHAAYEVEYSVPGSQRTMGGLGVSDFNEDGLPDIVMGGNARILIAYNAGDGFFFDLDVIRMGDAKADISLADIDLDGDIDVVAADLGLDQLSIAINRCGPWACSAADFDGSGTLNFGDVTVFLTLYGAGDPAADLARGIFLYTRNRVW